MARREEAIAAMAALCAEHAQSRELAAEQVALQMHCAAGWLRARRFADAERILRAVTAARPRDAAARSDLGLALIGLDRAAEAVAELEEALRIAPGRWQALHNLALARLNLDQLEEAFEAFEAAQALAPADAGLMANHAYARCLAHDFARGEALFQAALALERDHERASHYYSNYLLGRGRYAEGWAERARRPPPPRLAARSADFPQPAWTGDALAGRGILVRSEQGLGDQIMFCGAVPDLLGAGARVALECDPRLERLFARSFPGAVVAARGAQGRERLLAAAPDVQLPMGRLAHHLRRSREDFPRHAGYLRADPGRVEHWRGRLAALGPGRKIGISWAGGTARTGGPRRSTSLADWLPVLRLPGLRFVNLQYTDCHEELAQFRERHGIEVVHWQEAIDDYDETAALVCALDGVASVCTSVIHLAGALGRPVQVLVPWWPAWRYLFEGEEMPWYPSVRLIRQARVQDWSAPIARLAEALGRG
jgi:Flp pilus assembly protein TadD